MTYFDEGSLLDGAWLAEVSVGSVAVEQVKWLLLSAVLDYLWDEESACVCVS